MTTLDVLPALSYAGYWFEDVPAGGTNLWRVVGNSATLANLCGWFESRNAAIAFAAKTIGLPVDAGAPRA